MDARTSISCAMCIVVPSSDSAGELTVASSFFATLFFLFILCLGPFFDAQQLVFPQPFERTRPLVQRADRHSVHFVKHVATIPPNLHQAHILQNLQMLRNRRLLHLYRVHNLADGPLLCGQIIQDVPPARLCHCIERVRSCRRSCHCPNIHSHIGICQGSFLLRGTQNGLSQVTRNP